MKQVIVYFQDNEYEDLKQRQGSSEFSATSLNQYCKFLCLNPTIVQKSIDKETKAQLEELTSIMAVYGFFAEQADKPEIYRHYHEFDKLVHNKVNELV